MNYNVFLMNHYVRMGLLQHFALKCDTLSILCHPLSANLDRKSGQLASTFRQG